MSTITTNGITFTVTPYWPSALLSAQFSSAPSTAPSTTITLVPDKPVGMFQITIHDSTFAGNKLVGYDAAGIPVVETSATPSWMPGMGPPQPLTLFAPAGHPLTRIELVPAPNDFVAFSDVNAMPPTSVSNPPPLQLPPPQPTAPTPTPSPTPAPIPAPSPVNLNSIIQYSKNVINRAYVKGTLASLQTETIQIRNISPSIDVNVSLNSLPAIIFTPNQFVLNRNDVKTVTVSFDSTKLDLLPEGLNSYTIVVGLSAQNTSTPQPSPPTVVNTPPPPSPITTPPITTYTPSPTTYSPIPLAPAPTASSPTPIGVVTTYTPTPTGPSILIPEATSPPPTQGAAPPTGPQWINGTDGSVNLGYPPTGWVQDSTTGAWYPPTQVAPPETYWVNGVDGTINYGSPPTGWIQDPATGAWWSPTDPYALNGFSYTSPTGGGSGGSGGGGSGAPYDPTSISFT